MKLMEHQKKAFEQMHNGCVLWGGVGSGKSATVLAYYMKNETPKDIYVITTAKKRDSLDWEGAAAKFGIGTNVGATIAGTILIDSWNNIGKYTDVEDAFFVFDEQRLVGYGSWVKSFLKIAHQNNWVLLSATPGDIWLDYAPIFIANGFYRNITQFKLEHVLYEPFSRFPKVRGYLHEDVLMKYRNMILVEMPYLKHTIRHPVRIPVTYDVDNYNLVLKKRWHLFDHRPCKDAGEVVRVLRRVLNASEGRLEALEELLEKHPRVIVFYNFNYELEILRGLSSKHVVAEWNGHRKEPLPEGDKWVYLVQYVAGAEGWNCVRTDTTVFWSLTYSYKNFEQAHGRIDRLDTPYTDLYYYFLVSESHVDRGIWDTLMNKKSFNERVFGEQMLSKM